MSLLPPIEDFIYEYKVLLSDSDFMACAEDHDLPLISADYAAMCQPESIDYMWFVIAIEAVLLVVVLAKLGYDVWHYYKTGEMPWLANYICLGLGYSGEGREWYSAYI